MYRLTIAYMTYRLPVDQAFSLLQLAWTAENHQRKKRKDNNYIEGVHVAFFYHDVHIILYLVDDLLNFISSSGVDSLCVHVGVDSA